MENAIWNGKIYTASEISNSYELEKEIRKASGRKELLCPDPDCPNPILRYCHGEVKCAFFAHLDTCACDYSQFDKENSSVMRDVKQTLYNNFIDRGFDVKLEVKVLARHYTHLLFTLPNNKRIAVELGNHRTTANRIDYLTTQYANLGIETKWIVISDNNTPVKENETYFIKRYLLNENKRKDILIIDNNGIEVTQYVVDPNKYLFRGNVQVSENYPEIYSETSTLSNLVFENDELTISGFYKRYESWLAKKKRAFNKRLEELEEQFKENEKRRIEFAKRLQKIRSNPVAQPIKNQSNSPLAAEAKVSTPKTTGMSYEARRESILHKMNQQEHIVKDSMGERWIKCEKCGAIETTQHFGIYGGQNRATLGICNKCDKKD